MKMIHLLKPALFSILFITMQSIYAGNQIDLVNVAKEIPTIQLDILYATTNNFTGKRVYPVAKCYLRRSVVEKLKKVQEELLAMGLSLKIWDGYRPLSVQEIFWSLVPDERYVANPKKGSRHNRGAAVDLTIIYADSGKELLMPTAFDDFTEKAHADYMDLPAEVIKNRKLLSDLMAKHGFVPLPTEWWHFDDADWQQYEILNISYADLD